MTEDEPFTTPALPDELNVAPSAVLVNLPEPAPLFDAWPALSSSKFSVGSPSELVVVPALKTIGDFVRMIVCVAGSVSLTSVGASLAPVMVKVTGCDELTPYARRGPPDISTRSNEISA